MPFSLPFSSFQSHNGYMLVESFSAKPSIAPAAPFTLEGLVVGGLLIMGGAYVFAKIIQKTREELRKAFSF